MNTNPQREHRLCQMGGIGSFFTELPSFSSNGSIFVFSLLLISKAYSSRFQAVLILEPLGHSILDIPLLGLQYGRANSPKHTPSAEVNRAKRDLEHFSSYHISSSLTRTSQYVKIISVTPKRKLYDEVAVALNNDFRTLLHAVATDVGISIVSKRILSIQHLAVSVEASRVLTGKNLTVLVTDSGIICIR